MTPCPQCGAPTEQGQSFCATCGTTLTPEPSPGVEATPTAVSAPASPPAEPAPAPAAPPAQQAPSLASIDWSLLVRGNWIGAGVTALAAFLVALVGSAVIAVGVTDDFELGGVVGLTGLFTGATFGVNLMQGDGTVGQIPTLLTLLSLGAAILVFRRVTAGYPRWTSALGDAVRAGVLLSLLLTILAIVLKIATPEITGFDEEDEGEDLFELGFGEYLAVVFARIGIFAGDDGEKTTSSIPGAIFLGVLVLSIVLALSCLVRRDWLDARGATVHAWVAAPLAGLGALILGLTAAGAVYLVAVLVGEDSSRDVHHIASLVAVLPSLGMRILALGTGGAYGASVEFGSEEDDFSQRLAGFADDHGALFWLAIPIALALIFFSAHRVIARSPERTTVLRNVGVYLVLLLVALPILVHFAGYHGGGEEEGQDISLAAGVSGFDTTMLVVLISIGAALILLVLTGNLDVAKARAAASSLAQSIQTDPGQQPTGQEQRSTPPPAQPDEPPPSGPPTSLQ
jgi:hypothetical protein